MNHHQFIKFYSSVDNLKYFLNFFFPKILWLLWLENLRFFIFIITMENMKKLFLKKNSIPWLSIFLLNYTLSTKFPPYIHANSLHPLSIHPEHKLKLLKATFLEEMKSGYLKLRNLLLNFLLFILNRHLHRFIMQSFTA